MTLSLTTLRIEGSFTTLSIHDTQDKVGAITLSITTLGIMTLRTEGLFATLSINYA